MFLSQMLVSTLNMSWFYATCSVYQSVKLRTMDTCKMQTIANSRDFHISLYFHPLFQEVHLHIKNHRHQNK